MNYDNSDWSGSRGVTKFEVFLAGLSLGFLIGGLVIQWLIK